MKLPLTKLSDPLDLRKTLGKYFLIAGVYKKHILLWKMYCKHTDISYYVSSCQYQNFLAAFSFQRHSQTRNLHTNAWPDPAIQAAHHVHKCSCPSALCTVPALRSSPPEPRVKRVSSAWLPPSRPLSLLPSRQTGLKQVYFLATFSCLTTPSSSFPPPGGKSKPVLGANPPTERGGPGSAPATRRGDEGSCSRRFALPAQREVLGKCNYRRPFRGGKFKHK